MILRDSLKAKQSQNARQKIIEIQITKLWPGFIRQRNQNKNIWKETAEFIKWYQSIFNRYLHVITSYKAIIGNVQLNVCT